MVLKFIKNDAVLAISIILAMISCAFVLPSPKYFEYIDFQTLILLWCLMVIVEEVKSQGVFDVVSQLFLKYSKSIQGIVMLLVMMTFISSLFITNDVALITFVPLSLMIAQQLRLEKSVCLIITLMTIAANLGSMLSPLGNPQNLYLYTLSSMSFNHFIQLVLPYGCVSVLLLIIIVKFKFKQHNINLKMNNCYIEVNVQLIILLVLFMLCIFCVLGVVSHYILLMMVFVIMLWINKETLLSIDYSLLLTFVALFIFIGNLKQSIWLNDLMQHYLIGNEKLISVVMSQIISNVPAAMLLSSYTTHIDALIIGTNLGGLGTMIASMASLISYKQLVYTYPNYKFKYCLLFTVFNILFLIVLYSI